MNKKKLSTVICIVFILQLLVPLTMISYSRYIDWGLRERAAVYKIEISSMEYYVSTNSVYVDYVLTDYFGRHYVESAIKSVYASVKTGSDGFAYFDFSDRRPDGNYIRSQAERYFFLPGELRWWELRELIDYDGEGNWLYMLNSQFRNQWGYSYDEPPVYFESAYGEISVFKGYVRLNGVYIDGESIEVFVQRQVDEGAIVE